VYAHVQGQCHHWVEVQYSKHFGSPGPRQATHWISTSIILSIICRFDDDGVNEYNDTCVDFYDSDDTDVDNDDDGANPDRNSARNISVKDYTHKI